MSDDPRRKRPTDADTMQQWPSPSVLVSWGELIDKITILEIKQAKLIDPAALTNVARELGLLRASAPGEVLELPDVVLMKQELAEVNAALWSVEDQIREKEAAKAFDDEFIALARSVYRLNDERSVVKRAINALLASDIVEEKSYARY
jgi:Family of unknown function (DUF6165)